MAVHGRSLLAIMARFSGRLDEAAGHAEVLRALDGIVDDESYPWMGRAATFVVAVARGGVGLAPPLAPVDSPDPVVGMALLVIEAELTVAGRVDEALARFDVVERPGLGPFGDLAGVLNGLALVLAGRRDEALPWIERAAESARALEAPRRDGRGRRARRRRSPGTGDRLCHRPRRSASSIGEALRPAGPRRAGRRAAPRGPAARARTPRHAGPAPRAVERPPASGPEMPSAGRGRLVAEDRLGVAVSDRERPPAMRTTDVDVLVRHLDVLGFEDHVPPAEPAFRRQGRCRRPEPPITGTGIGHEPPSCAPANVSLNYLTYPQ